MSPAEKEALRQGRRDRHTAALAVAPPVPNHPAPSAVHEPPHKQRRTSCVTTAASTSDSDSSSDSPPCTTTSTVVLGATATAKPAPLPKVTPLPSPTVYIQPVDTPSSDPILLKAILLVNTSHPDYEKTQRAHPTFFPPPVGNPNLWRASDPAVVSKLRAAASHTGYCPPYNKWWYLKNVPGYSSAGRMTVEQKLLLLGASPSQAAKIDPVGHQLDAHYYFMYGHNGLYPDGLSHGGTQLPLYLRDRDAYDAELHQTKFRLCDQMLAQEARRHLEQPTLPRNIDAAAMFLSDDSIDQFGPGAHKSVPKPKVA
jgi:hypothetical protein